MITHETIMDTAALLIWLRKHENNKTDPHTEFAAFLYGIPVESVGYSDRNRAKAALYLHLYGGTPLYAPISPRSRLDLGYYMGFVGRRSWVRGYEAVLQQERFRYEPRNRRIAARRRADAGRGGRPVQQGHRAHQRDQEGGYGCSRNV